MATVKTQMAARCVRPYEVRPGVRVSCGNCAWCRINRVNDFVGRCIAELKVSDGAIALTLTYGGDVAGATRLDYRDVQLMLKRLRIDGYKVRYICAGEYGSLKRRAHWHCVLFFRGKKPPFDALSQRLHWPYWRHGHVFPQPINYDGFRYLLKYVLKTSEIGDDASITDIKTVHMSKKPPLGADYFAMRAKLFVDNHIAFQSPEYFFPEVKTKVSVKVRKFWLQDRSLELFLETYVRLWNETHGCNPPDHPELWRLLYDKQQKKINLADTEWVEADLEKKRRADIRDGVRSAFGQRNVAHNPKVPLHVGSLFIAPDGVIVAYSDGSAVLVWDGHKWQISGGNSGKSVVSVPEQLTLCGLPDMLISVVSEWLSRRARSVPHPISAEVSTMVSSLSN